MAYGPDMEFSCLDRFHHFLFQHQVLDIGLGDDDPLGSIQPRALQTL